VVCHCEDDNAQQQKVLKAVALLRKSYVVSQSRLEQKAEQVKDNDSVADRQGASIKDNSN